MPFSTQGPAEDYVGAFRKGPFASTAAEKCQFFTKWVPRPGVMDREVVDAAVTKSLKRMKVEQLDLLQFHWLELPCLL